MSKRLMLVLLALLLAAGLAVAQKKPLGSEENPIVWAFVPSGEMERVSAGAQQVADLLHDKTGPVLQDPGGHRVRRGHRGAAGQPAHGAHDLTGHLRLHHGRRHGRGPGRPGVGAQQGPFYKGQIIARAGSGITKLADLKGKTFARRGPAVHQRLDHPHADHEGRRHRAGARPKQIVDAGSHDAVVAAVYNGDVDAGACYVDARTRIEKDKPDVMEKVVVLQESAADPQRRRAVQPHGAQGPAGQDRDGHAGHRSRPRTARRPSTWPTSGTTWYRKDDTFYDPFRQVLQAAGMKAADLLKK